MTFVIGKTRDRDAVDTKHECLQGRMDISKIADRIDNPRLERQCMGYFQQGIYVFQVRLPEPEDLGFLGMQGEKIHISLWLAEQKIIGGMVILFRRVDVVVPGVCYLVVLHILTVAVVIFGF